jgi:phospholipid/cholesterol/gamma-HCH transport system substrate-binding protein
VPRALTALNQTQDEVEFARPYTPDLLGFITNVSQISAYYDGSGHYARIQPVGANLFDRNEATGVLEPITAAQQFDGYTAFGLGPFTRCPGAATQPIPGSNPFLDDGNLVDDADCDDDDVIPGP